MARSNNLELLQCLTFAYFAKNRYNYDEMHQMGWQDLFSPYEAKRDIIVDINGMRKTIEKGTHFTETIVKEINDNPSDFEKNAMKKRYRGEMASSFNSQFGEYLRSSFNFGKMIEAYEGRITHGKNGRMVYTIKPKVKMAYKVAEAFVKNNFIHNDLSAYQFLDQDDDFTTTVKDESLKHIHKVFKVKGSYETLSPVDMFMVQANKKVAILKEFQEHVVDASDEKLLSNMAFGKFGKNTYRTITNKYFHDRSLIGVSLKFPKTIDGAKSMKIVGTTVIEPHLQSFIDPYGKLLAAMMAENGDINMLINKAIDIRFNEFRIESNLSAWEYPVVFRYQDIVDPDTHQPLYNTNLKFELLTWKDVGFNGRWIIGGQKTTWVSGIGIGTAEHMFFHYREYADVVNDLASIRTREFMKMVPKKVVPQKMMSDYEAALKELAISKILVTKKLKMTDKFLDRMRLINKQATSSNFRFAVIQALTSGMKSNLPTKNVAYNDTHYNAAQLAYFLFRGGKRGELFLKRRIFLSLFGMLTKSGYKIFDSTNPKAEMRNYIQKEIDKKSGKVEAYFNAAPYILLS